METAEHHITDAREGPVVLGRYALLRRLGSGGFGVVWLAHDRHLDREVAVKRIAVDPGREDLAGRAEREAKAAARLQHAGIVALYESGRDEEAVYLVSELVRGRTLAQLEADGALSDRDVVEIGITLCAALTHAHGRGVIHRDVKPGNIIVPEDGGTAKLTDFGIARLLGDDGLTMTGDVVGTLAYMAPEQAEGREAGAPADLYALGLVLYEGLSGVNPVRGRTPASTAKRVGVRLPALARLRRDLPLELCAAIDVAVRPRPEDRGTVKALRAALVAARDDVGDEPGTIEGGALEVVGGATGMAQALRTRRDRRRWAREAREAEREWEGAAFRPSPAGPIPDGEPTAPIAARSRAGARLLAAAGTAALAAAALAAFGPDPPVTPLAGAAIAAGAVVLLPRVGFALAAAALTVWLASAGRGGDAVLLAVAAAAVPAGLLTSSPAWWPVPALAPLLGAAGLAGAFPAVAGQARGAVHRAALGILGAWWVLLAEPLSGRLLLLGPAPDTAPRAAFGPSGGAAFDHVVAPVLTHGALGIAVVWGVFAAALPVLVRGRSAPLDIVAATGWAAGLAAATQAVARALPWDGGGVEPRGMVPSAVAAGIIAMACAASRVRD